jgi:predicted esterase
MASLEPHFTRLVARRRLMTTYHELHASIHAKHSHLKVLHAVGDDATSLAWTTPVFEFYCVAGPNVSRATITQGANKIIQWAKREEERLFIIGGGVF